MPPKKRPGVTGVYHEWPDELLAEFRAFVAAFPLGTDREHVMMAVRRHMANPPSVVGVETLPPAPAEPELKPRRRKK